MGMQRLLYRRRFNRRLNPRNGLWFYDGARDQCRVLCGGVLRDEHIKPEPTGNRPDRPRAERALAKRVAGANRLTSRGGVAPAQVAAYQTGVTLIGMQEDRSQMLLRRRG